MQLVPFLRQSWRVLAVVLVVAAVFLTMRGMPVLQWIESFRVWAAGFGSVGVLLYGGFFGLSAILMMPCLPFAILAGFTFGWVGGLIAVNIGILIGASFGFLVVRQIARGKLANRIAANTRFQAIDRAIARDGWKIIGLLRMCPVPFGLTNYLYGLTGIGFWHYLAATLVGMLPGNVMFVYLGALGKRTLDGPRHPVEYASAVLAVCAIAAVTLILRRIARRATQV